MRCPNGAPYGGQEDERYFVNSKLQRRHGCRCGSIRLDDAHPQARELLARTLRDPADPANAGVAWGRGPIEDTSAAERVEVDAALERLAELRVLGKIELSAYTRLYAELVERRAQIAPPKEADTSPPPALLQFADAVEAASDIELSELLDVLGAQFVHEHGLLTLVKLDPLGLD